MRRLVPARLGLLLTLILIMLSLLIGRLAFLQLWLGRSFAEEARANAVREAPMPERRGRILDRHGIILAGNRAALTVSLVQPADPGLGKRIPALSEALGMAPEVIRDKVAAQAGRLYVPVVLVPDADPVLYTRLAERGSDYPELTLGVSALRDYPLGPAAAHITGYLSETTEHDIQDYPGIYALGDRRGFSGVEQACDWVLRGNPGRTTYEVDAAGNPVRRLDTVESRPGLDVRLTVDAELQFAAHESLLASLAALKPEARAWGAGGAVVALDPRSGAVLALVSLPSFDPAIFVTSTPGEVIQGLTGDPSRPFLNRVAQGLYGPGSTFKVITAVAALEEGVTDAAEVIYDGGRHRMIPKKCWKAGGHGPVRLREAVMGSCNVYFYEMGLRLGIDRLAAHARQFGLGRPADLDLFRPHAGLGPGVTGPPSLAVEPSGTLPDAAWKAALFPDDPTVWPAEVMDAAIGEGFHAYPPLQLAVAVAAIANGGTVWRPYLIDALVDPADGHVVIQARPEGRGLAPVSASSLETVRGAMTAAAMDTSPFAGTGTGVFGPSFEARWGVRVGGKTGTHERAAEDPRDDDGLFVCFAPADDPAIVVAVVVEQGRSGSRSAAPVARAVIEAWLTQRESTASPGG